MSRRKPTGFVATCQCGKNVGALDLERSTREDTARLLGQWLMHGCTVAPRFTGTWSVRIEACACETPSATPRVNPACGVHGPIPCEGAGCTCGVMASHTDQPKEPK